MRQLPPSSRIRSAMLASRCAGFAERLVKTPAIVLHHHDQPLRVPLDLQPQLGGFRMFDCIIERFLDGP